MPLASRSGARLSVTLCPRCFTSYFTPLLVEQGRARQGSTGQATVLVVDDDPGVRQLLRLALEGDGFRVDLAANGEEALEKVGDEPPRAIVLDLRMPVMSGPDFLRALRRSTAGQSIPVIAISAYGLHADESDLGVSAFLRKPFEVQVLLGAVNGLIAGPA